MSSTQLSDDVAEEGSRQSETIQNPPEIGSAWEFTLSGETFEVVQFNGLEVVLVEESGASCRVVDARKWDEAPFIKQDSQ